MIRIPPLLLLAIASLAPFQASAIEPPSLAHKIHIPRQTPDLVLSYHRTISNNANAATAGAILSLRGGGDGGEFTDADAVASKIDLELTPAKIATYTGAALLAAFTIALVKKIPRCAGHAPAFVAEALANVGISEMGATGLFHLAYFLHCIVVIKIMPSGLKEVVFSPAGVILLGTVFPLVESIKAASRDTSGKASQTWLMYWIMHGMFSFASHDMSKMVERFGPQGGKHWYEFQFYMVLWLILPFTDGAAIIYELVTKPYIVPVVKPIAERAEGWLTTVALTIINASHLWFVIFFFMALPTFLKRFAVIATGTTYPVVATIVAVATDVGGDDTKWLTYWSCFSLLYLGMISAEKFVGKVPGLYTLCLGITLYLMLPIFDGSDAVFRQILVPLFQMREALIVKDAKMLAREVAKKLPEHRHEEARKAAANAFLEETSKITDTAK